MSILGGLGGGGAGRPKTSAVPYVSERDFEAEVLRSPIPVLVEFTTEWSQPCKQIAPEVESFAQEMEGKARVVRVDVEKSPMLAQQLRVQSVPMFVVIVDQGVGDVKVGALGKKQMRAMIEPFLPRQAGAIKAIELAQVLKAGGAVPIDTRDKAAFDRARIPGATSMPLEEIEGRLAELFMHAGQPVLYCRSGDKTKDLAVKLQEQGVEVAFLEGGLLAWESEGLPVER